MKMYTVNQSEIVQWINLLEEQGAARLRALSQLGRIGVLARGHRPLRRGSLHTPAPSLFNQTAPASPLGALPAQFMEVLSDPVPVVRREAAFALGELGGETAIMALERLAADPNTDVRLVAVDALAKIGGLQSVQILSQATHDESELVRARAVHALGQLARGEEGPEVETIRGMLARIREGDASAYVRDAAREALAALEGKKVPTLIPELLWLSPKSSVSSG